MAKRKGNDGWWIVFTAVGLGVLYYLQTGLGQGNDAAGIPDKLEREIDDLVAELNNRVGKDWVKLGATALTFHLRATLPKPLVELVGVVAAVENESKRRSMTSKQKQQLAIQMARNI